jgi:hypothetical protein
MNTTAVKTQSLWRTALIDVVLITVACLVPTLSHLAAVPLYQLNPMLIVLMTGMLLVNDRRNAFLLAVLLPLVSMLAVGMPTPAKALCMGAELLTLVSVFTLMQSRWGFASASVAGRFTAVVAAMLCGKMGYYALKAVILAPAVLVSTPWTIQLLVMIGVALLFALLQRK